MEKYFAQEKNSSTVYDSLKRDIETTQQINDQSQYFDH
jgi:hypothetical protein